MSQKVGGKNQKITFDFNPPGSTHATLLQHGVTVESLSNIHYSEWCMTVYLVLGSDSMNKMECAKLT